MTAAAAERARVFAGGGAWTRSGALAHVLAVLPALLVSRALVWLGTELGAFLSEPGAVVPHVTLAAWFRWDALRYLGIAAHGYHDLVTAAFFPLYPYAIRGLGQLIGAEAAALLIPNLAFAAALALFHAEAQALFDPRRAGLATWVLAVWPWSVFFSYPYTESLFLLFVLAAFRLMAHRRWVLAGLAGALAAATRAPGILVAAAFAGELLGERQAGRRRLAGPLLGLVLTALGLAAFALMLWRFIGDPLGFWHGEDAWIYPYRNPLFPLGAVVQMFRDFNPFKTESLGLPVAAAFAVAAVWAARRLPWRYGAFTLVTVALFIYEGWHLGEYHSVPRYLVVDFVCFFAFGAVLARYDWLRTPWIALSATLLTVEAALYGSNHFIG